VSARVDNRDAAQTEVRAGAGRVTAPAHGQEPATEPH
jgi:hypothetical protein